MEVVFSNILDNAIIFSNPKSEVQIKLFRKDKFVVCQVRDYGAGFSDYAHENLFKPFSNVKEHIDSNMGLSLYFVKLVMDAHQELVTIKKMKTGSLITLMFSQLD